MKFIKSALATTCLSAAFGLTAAYQQADQPEKIPNPETTEFTVQHHNYPVADQVQIEFIPDTLIDVTLNGQDISQAATLSASLTHPRVYYYMQDSRDISKNAQFLTPLALSEVQKKDHAGLMDVMNVLTAAEPSLSGYLKAHVKCIKNSQATEMTCVASEFKPG